MTGFAIAIDGPVAAGKGTIAGLLAHHLHGFHLNTGAMYRCLALFCLENGISVSDQKAVVEALTHVWFDMTDDAVFMNGEDVTEKLKQRSVTTTVPKVAAIREVREEMVKRQREIGLKKIENGNVVIAEGRDAATKIFPDAKMKIFLTARPEIRAQRRFEQMGGKHNATISYDQILADTKERDYKDTHRTVDPLVSDPEEYGYMVLDDSDLNEEETIEKVLKELSL
ncbi:MAG TPA: (d)CMP kinase [Patescibacteria group bacterium]|nr:(d)CMP kinase [Patescibacteria group bacterium]